jgi:hypothetical protein
MKPTIVQELDSLDTEPVLSDEQYKALRVGHSDSVCWKRDQCSIVAIAKTLSLGFAGSKMVNFSERPDAEPACAPLKHK